MSEIDALRAEVADLKWQRDGAVDQAAALLVERDELREALHKVCRCLRWFVNQIGQRQPGWEEVHRMFFGTIEGTMWDDSSQVLADIERTLTTTQDNNAGPGKPNG